MVEYMLGLFRLSKISAMNFCITCFWAAQAGVEAAKPFAFGPGKATGHYSRKMDSVLKTGSSENQYFIEVPGHSKHDACRMQHQLPVQVPHEMLEAELAKDASVS
eukprot:5752199-Alexandrium_andersonii.AAC.1